MVARTLGLMAAAEEHLQQPSPKRTRSEQPVSHGCLSGRQWVDVQRAARIASATNVQLTVHGIVVDGSAARQQQRTQQLKPQNQGTVPSASQLAAPAKSTSSTIVVDAAPPRSPNARHRRSQRRLQDYQQAKTALAQQPPSQQPPQLPKTQPPEPPPHQHPRAAHACLEGVINLNSSKQSSAPPMPTPPPMPSPPPPMPSPPPPMSPPSCWNGKSSEMELVTANTTQAIHVPQHQHILKFHRREQGYNCDVCHRSFSAGDHSYYCSNCDFDACISCSSKYFTQPNPPRSPLRPPLSPLSPSQLSLTPQPTPLQPTALATRSIPKPPTPATEDLHDKIASRIDEARKIRAGEQQAQYAHNRAIEDLASKLFEEWRRSTIHTWPDGSSPQYYEGHRSRIRREAFTIVLNQRLNQRRQQDHAVTAVSR